MEYCLSSEEAAACLGAAFAMEGRDLAAAESHLHEAVSALRQAGDKGDLCAALFELGNIAAQRGDLQSALDFYDEAARTAEAGHIHYYLALARNNYAYHSLLLGQIEAAEKAATQGVKVAETYDLLAALLHLYSTRGEIHLYLAEWKLAEESFQRGLAIAEDLGSLERKAGYRGGMALAAPRPGRSPRSRPPSEGCPFQDPRFRLLAPLHPPADLAGGNLFLGRQSRRSRRGPGSCLRHCP